MHNDRTNMDYVTIIGLVAAAFTTISLLPQIVKAVQTKSTKDISTWMFSLFCAGVFLWFVYGVLIWDLPIILANSLAFIQAVVILVLKYKYRKR
jgi:MtN3 and saliva related transmembrane protein